MRNAFTTTAVLLLILGGCARNDNSLPIIQVEQLAKVSFQTEAAGDRPSLKIVGTQIEGNRLVADVVAVNPLNAAAIYEGDPPDGKVLGAINPVYVLQTRTAADANWLDFEVQWDCGTELDQRRLPAQYAGSFHAALDGFLNPEVKTMRVGLLFSWSDADGVRHEEVCWSDTVTPKSTAGIALELGDDKYNTYPLKQAEKEFKVSLEKETAADAPVQKVIGPRKVPSGETVIEVVMVNPLDVASEYCGYTMDAWQDRPPPGEISPLYRGEIKTSVDGKWQEASLGWCGTGAGEMLIRPGHAAHFYVRPEANAVAQRVIVDCQWKDKNGEDKTQKLSAEFKPVE